VKNQGTKVKYSSVRDHYTIADIDENSVDAQEISNDSDGW
jgi:hypothetical protein